MDSMQSSPDHVAAPLRALGDYPETLPRILSHTNEKLRQRFPFYRILYSPRLAQYEGSSTKPILPALDVFADTDTSLQD